MTWSQANYLAALTRLEGRVKILRDQLPPSKADIHEQVRAQLPRYRQTEADLHEQIFAECRRRGWLALHGSMSERTHRTMGEPDFVILANDGLVLFVECKTSTGKLSTEQQALHAWARKLGHEVHVVRSLAEFLALTTGA